VLAEVNENENGPSFNTLQSSFPAGKTATPFEPEGELSVA
jgi:hypothetical protein